MQEKINIVLVSGKAGVGKTTFAHKLQHYLLENSIFPVEVSIIPFAKAVKETATLVDWDGKKDSKGRKLLQQLGDVVREYDKDTWVRKTFSEIQGRFLGSDWGNFVVIVDDWRFYNERDFLKGCDCNIFCIRIEAPNREILRGTPEYAHISETELPSCILGNHVFMDDITYDLVIDNTGSMDTLDEVAESVASVVSSEFNFI